MCMTMAQGPVSATTVLLLIFAPFLSQSHLSLNAPEYASIDASKPLTNVVKGSAAVAAGGWPTFPAESINPKRITSIFNLGVPHLSWFSKGGALLGGQIFPWVFGVRSVNVDGPHFSQSTREMGHPQGLTFVTLRFERDVGHPSAKNDIQ